MSEAEADIDALIDDVPLEGEERPEPAKDEKAKKADKDDDSDDKSETGDSKEKRAAKIDKQLHKALEKHLEKPELAQLMVDILQPGLAVVNLKIPELTPLQHFALAFGGIGLAAMATNPEIMAKLRAGLARKKSGAKGSLPSKTDKAKKDTDTDKETTA